MKDLVRDPVSLFTAIGVITVCAWMVVVLNVTDDCKTGVEWNRGIPACAQP